MICDLVIFLSNGGRRDENQFECSNRTAFHGPNDKATMLSYIVFFVLVHYCSDCNTIVVGVKLKKLLSFSFFFIMMHKANLVWSASVFFSCM